MPNGPRPNPNVPPMLAPGDSLDNYQSFALAAKEAIESLAGHIGRPLDRAVTFNDLIALGLVTKTVAEGAGTGGRVVYVSRAVFEDLVYRVEQLERSRGP